MNDKNLLEETIKYLQAQVEHLNIKTELADYKRIQQESLREVEALKVTVGYLLAGSVQWRRGEPEHTGHYLGVWPQTPPEICSFNAGVEYGWTRYIPAQEPGTYWSEPLWWATPPDEMVDFATFKATWDVARQQKDAMFSQYVQAVGLASTLCPHMLVNIDKPVEMMQEVVAQVMAERAIEPQWDAIPAEYVWHAFDANGRSAAYTVMPTPHDREWFLPEGSSIREKALITNLAPHKLVVPWQNTLRYRPQAREQ